MKKLFEYLKQQIREAEKMQDSVLLAKWQAVVAALKGDFRGIDRIMGEHSDNQN